MSPDNTSISPDFEQSPNVNLQASDLGRMSLAAFSASHFNRFPTPSSSDPSNLRVDKDEPGNPSSPSNPFALDPELHPEILSDAIQGALSPPAENRLNDFAQHVLEVQDDAAHILDFTSAEEETLFGTNQAHQSFGGLLEATGQNMNHEEDGKHDGYDGQGAEGDSGHDGAEDTPGGRQRYGGRKRGREADDGENGTNLDPVKVKKDSHVRSRPYNQQ